jgi:hypothetical protein
VKLFRVSDDSFAGETISDASGNYTIANPAGGPFRAVFYKPAPAAMRFYFHTEDTLQGAPAAPTGNRTISELVPDQTAGAAPSIAGGHLSTSGSVPASLLNKPTTKDLTEVAGLPPLVDLPVAAHRFGWFSDVKYTGFFKPESWQFQWSEDDDNAGIVGRSILNIFASDTRDFAGAMRLLAQLDPKTTDWWISATDSVGSWTTESQRKIQMFNEYLFVQLWCHESSGFSAGRTLTFDQEGSDRLDARRSWLLTPPFTSSVGVVAGTTVDTLQAA